jgi:hypothetical protein
MAEAAIWFRRACEQDGYEGCVKLGMMTAEGWGVAADLPEAERLLRRACELDDGGHYYLAQLLKRLGKHDEAAKELRIACAAGGQIACVDLARALIHGVGVAAAPLEAKPLLETSCAAKFGDACYLLGLAYENGSFGGGRDYEAAGRSYAAACDLGSRKGCDEVEHERKRTGPRMPDMLDAVYRFEKEIWQCADASGVRAQPTLQLAVTFGSSGDVTDVQPLGSNEGDTALKSCVYGHLRSAKVPPFTEVQHVLKMQIGRPKASGQAAAPADADKPK